MGSRNYSNKAQKDRHESARRRRANAAEREGALRGIGSRAMRRRKRPMTEAERRRVRAAAQREMRERARRRAERARQVQARRQRKPTVRATGSNFAYTPPPPPRSGPAKGMRFSASFKANFVPSGCSMSHGRGGAVEITCRARGSVVFKRKIYWEKGLLYGVDDVYFCRDRRATARCQAVQYRYKRGQISHAYMHRNGKSRTVKIRASALPRYKAVAETGAVKRVGKPGAGGLPRRGTGPIFWPGPRPDRVFASFYHFDRATYVPWPARVARYNGDDAERDCNKRNQAACVVFANWLQRTTAPGVVGTSPFAAKIRSLRQRACKRGHSVACYELTLSAKKQRKALLTRSCKLGYAKGCLALRRKHPPRDVLALARRGCAAGSSDLCTEAASILVKQGDKAGAKKLRDRRNRLERDNRKRSRAKLTFLKANGYTFEDSMKVRKRVRELVTARYRGQR